MPGWTSPQFLDLDPDLRALAEGMTNAPSNMWRQLYETQEARGDAGWDSPQWSAGDHPREDNGQFSSGAGETSKEPDGAKFFKGQDVDWAYQDAENPKSRFTIAHMSPTDFLNMASYGLDEEKQNRVNDVLKEHGSFSSLPYLKIDENGKIVGHEGRHRMRALRRQGIKEVPVMLHSATHRWGEHPQEERPAELIAQKPMNHRLPMPDSTNFPLKEGVERKTYTEPKSVAEEFLERERKKDEEGRDAVPDDDLRPRWTSDDDDPRD